MSYYTQHREKDREKVQQRANSHCLWVVGLLFTFGYAILTFSAMKIYYFSSES